ncbi:MAG: GH3 family domain-containing protein [Archangium sp.]
MLVTALNVAWAASLARSASRFHRASERVERSQQEWLSGFLKANEDTAYGRAHGYSRIQSARDFQQRVPVVDYETLRPWVNRIADGEAHVLTREPVKMLERTSGSTSASKWIPYTEGLLSDFGAATSPWLNDLTRSFPKLLMTRHYWSVSPAAREPEVTKGGLRVGLEDDTEYFDALTRAAMKMLFAVDGSVARIRDVEPWRRETLRALISAEDLGFISVWNPSFLTLLMEHVDVNALSIVQRRAVDRLGLVGEALWPRLQVISCWTDAWASHALPALRRFFPNTLIQGKGLLATEGVVTFPLWGRAAPVAAVTSHFLEFEGDDGIRLAHQLREGETYAPIITTRGGFARYRLADQLRCVGFFNEVPMLRFEGRLDRTSDLVGEKLNSVFVEEAVRSLGLNGFVLLAPALSPSRYVLFAEEPRDDSAARLEERLLQNPHYRYARELGQLAPLEVRRVVDGDAKYVAAMRARGMRLGDIKPSCFDPSPGWNFDV